MVGIFFHPESSNLVRIEKKEEAYVLDGRCAILKAKSQVHHSITLWALGKRLEGGVVSLKRMVCQFQNVMFSVFNKSCREKTTNQRTPQQKSADFSRYTTTFLACGGGALIPNVPFRR